MIKHKTKFSFSTPDTHRTNLEYEKIQKIKRNIAELNIKQEILNIDKFGNMSTVTSVITIQVHNRITYLRCVTQCCHVIINQPHLRYLIESLSVATNIEKTLLIFSHDVWDEDINDLIRLVFLLQKFISLIILIILLQIYQLYNGAANFLPLLSPAASQHISWSFSWGLQERLELEKVPWDQLHQLHVAWHSWTLQVHYHLCIRE